MSRSTSRVPVGILQTRRPHRGTKSDLFSGDPTSVGERGVLGTLKKDSMCRPPSDGILCTFLSVPFTPQSREQRGPTTPDWSGLGVGLGGLDRGPRHDSLPTWTSQWTPRVTETLSTGHSRDVPRGARPRPDSL